MVFSVNKKDISEKLQSLTSIIPSKSTMMVLANFKIQTDSETNLITITATDLNITTVVKIPANVLENGSILVSAKHLSDIINALPETQINFSLKDDHLIIECGNSNFTISYIEASLFPEISFIENSQEFTFVAESFKRLVQNSTFCAATDSNQSICNGVYFRIEENLVTMAATDTKRIGEAKLTSELAIETPYEIILPTRALNFLEKNLTSDIDDIVVKFDEHRISFQIKSTLLISNKYEGRYPSYNVAFRNLPTTTLMVDKGAFRDAVRRVSLLSEDDDKLIKISLNNTEIKVESLISERGNAKEIITNFNYDGEEVYFCLNARLLQSIVNVIESDEIVFKFRSTVEPIWIQNNIDFEGMEIRFILMPMRIDKSRM